MFNNFDKPQQFKISALVVVFVLLMISLQSLANSEITLRDPTAPVGGFVRTETRPQLELNAIVYSSGRKLAIIDGREMKEGDSARGIKILRIMESSVLVEQNGIKRSLRLHSGPQIRR